MKPVLRPFRNNEDFTLLAAILTASQNADNLPVTIAPEYLAERLSTAPRFDRFRDLIIVELDGQGAGYGRVAWSEEGSNLIFNLAGFVSLNARRKGVGRALLAWLESRASQIAAEKPVPARLRINATQYQIGLHTLVGQAGYTVKESWVLMVRPNLDDIRHFPLPDGLEVRPALPEHFSAIWRAVEEAYEPDGGSPPTGVIPADFRASPTFQPECWEIAWDVSRNRVVGSVMAYINHAENEQLGILRGYTEGISTVPDWQHRGLARALIARSLRAQRAAGMSESALICSGEKPGNMALYASCGFQEVKRDTVYEKRLETRKRIFEET